MRGIRRYAVLTVSMALNLCLLILLLCAPSVSEPISKGEATRSLVPAHRHTSPKLRWSDIESNSQDRFIANLRAIGCPDKFIHNAVVADIDRRYDEKRLEIAHISNFWQTHDARRAEELERRGQLIHLDEQWRRGLEAATGEPAALAPRKNLPGRKRAAIRAWMFGFLKPDQLERAAALFEDADRLGDRLNHTFENTSEKDLLERRQHYHTRFLENTTGLLDETQLRLVESFLYSMYLFDVWKSEKQFGRDLSFQEERAVAEILMPPDYLAHSLFKLPLASTQDDALVAERESLLRERFGDELVEHYRQFNNERTLQNMVFPKQ